MKQKRTYKALVTTICTVTLLLPNVISVTQIRILFSIKYIVVPSIIIYHSILENSLYFKGLCM